MKMYFCLIKVLFLVSAVCLIHTAPAIAQRSCDLELKIVEPADNAEIPFGDTATISYSIKNLGPEDITEQDTIYLNMQDMPFLTFLHEHIAVGDSVIYPYLSIWNESDSDLVFSACLFLRADMNHSIVDSFHANDSACVTFILKGSSTGIADVSGSGAAPEKIALYPNPASTFVSIPLDNTLRKEGAVYVKDLLGRTCLQYSYGPAAVSGSKALQLDVSALKPGVYFVEVNAAGKRYSGKLLIRK